MPTLPPELQVAKTDVLVLGGGLAGHRAAVAAREAGARVALAYLARGASPFVIGANVPLGHVDERDSPEVYAADMIRGGYGLNDRRLVHVLAHGAVDALQELAALGVPFARDGERFRQRHLSGNTYPRSVYVPKGTGRVIIEHLAARCQTLDVQVWAGWKAVSLLEDGGEVAGALLVRRHGGELLAIRAAAVVLAMGGIGRLYDESTYPADVAADAYALACDAGATLVDMEFVQFEPLVTVHPVGCKGMEMPTAMMGDGAHLLNAAGERFMFRYNPEHGEKRIEKARLSLCIQQEIDEGRGLPDGTVLMDTTVVPGDALESYVAHVRRLRAAGLDPAQEGPHVRPAAHSEMGGVFIDEQGFAGVPGLFAGGEAAGGVHGASRLAGNGGACTIVFGAVAGRGAAASLEGPKRRDWARIEAQGLERLRTATGQARGAQAEEIKAAVRRTMSAAGGLYRTDEGLRAGIEQIRGLQGEIAAGLRAGDLAAAVKALEARNMAIIAQMILRAALARNESRGAHQRRDFPEQDDARWLKHLAWRKGAGGEPVLDELPIH